MYGCLTCGYNWLTGLADYDLGGRNGNWRRIWEKPAIDTLGESETEFLGVADKLQ